MNASGKSTLMKATGICILLAQAGCFVPAKEMILRPFRSIYTRILNQDNIFAGLSSFAVEMSELRDILRNATSNTLVLGDELCAGTESISAQALFILQISAFFCSRRNESPHTRNRLRPSHPRSQTEHHAPPRSTKSAIARYSLLKPLCRKNH